MTNENRQDQTSNLPQVEVLGNGDGSRYHKDIPDYRTADAETRAAIDALIATVDWNNINTLIGFGKDAKSDVLAVSRKINDRVAAEDSFLTDVRNVGEMISNLDLEAIGERVSALASGGYSVVKNNKAEIATGIAVGILASPLAGIAAALGLKGFLTGKKALENGAKKVKSKVSGEIDYEGESEAVRDGLRKAILEVHGIVASLETAQKSIPGYIDEINEMGNARLQSYSKLTLAIGAGNELIRRFDEDILPAAQADGMDLGTLQHLQLCGQALSRNVEGLTAARAVSLQNIVVLTESSRMYVNMQMKIEEHLTSSVPEWEGQISQGNMLVKQYDLQKSIDAADKKGIELRQSQEKLYLAARKMHDTSMLQGTYNLEQVTQLTQNMTRRLQADLSNVDEYRGRQSAARLKLAQATEALATTFQDSAQAQVRALAGPAAATPQGAGFQRLTQTSNDNRATDVTDVVVEDKKGETSPVQPKGFSVE